MVHICRQLISALCVPQNLCLLYQRHADIQRQEDPAKELAGSLLYHVKEKGITPTILDSIKNTSKDIFS